MYLCHIVFGGLSFEVGPLVLPQLSIPIAFYDLHRCIESILIFPDPTGGRHVLRGDGLQRDVLEGRMLGNRPRGRPGRGMIDDLMEGSYVKMNRRAERRKEWRE